MELPSSAVVKASGTGLTPTADGGTDIRWSATWQPKYPGTGPLLRLSIRMIYRSFSAGLARKASETASV